jgi:hypothetical protein
VSVFGPVISKAIFLSNTNWSKSFTILNSPKLNPISALYDAFSMV